MAKYDSADTIVTRDRRGRRQFMQRSATVLAAGTAVITSSQALSQALASDCDQYSGEEKARCSDSDASGAEGSGGDPAVCGCPPSSEAPARYETEDKVPELLLKVARVR